MALATFYFAGELTSGVTIELSEQESQHASRARRMALGDAVQVINGRGRLARCVIQAISKRNVQLKVVSVSEQARPKFKLIIASAITKGDRQKNMLDMLTQLGVDEYIPLSCERSVSKLGANSLEKWQRICLEACKQSQRAHAPTIASAMSVEQCLSEYQQAHIIVADFNGVQAEQVAIDNQSDIVIMIGPEGGFSADELSLFEEHNCTKLLMGEFILRTDTACIAAASLFSRVKVN